MKSVLEFLGLFQCIKILTGLCEFMVYDKRRLHLLMQKVALNSVLKYLSYLFHVNKILIFFTNIYLYS